MSIQNSVRLRACILILILICTVTGCRQPKKAFMIKSHPAPVSVTSRHFRVYSGSGTPLAFDEMIQSAMSADAVFIGETHGDPICHHLERRILEAMYLAGRPSAASERERPLFLSLEMFERDVQTVLDEYLKGLITENHFIGASRPWPRYAFDYRPLVEFAREKRLAVIAANAPARYVNRVARTGREGLAALSETAGTWLPKLPYGKASEAYAEKFREFWEDTRKEEKEKTGNNLGNGDAESPRPNEMTFEFRHMLDAQTLWDAAMADSVARALNREPEAQVLHVTGQFHCVRGLGIPEHLERQRKGTRRFIICILPSETFPDFDPERTEWADAVIITRTDIR